MKSRILILFLVVFLFSCGTQKRFGREYSGKPLSVLKESFGEPKTILDQEEGQVYVFEKEEDLKSTEIRQGKLTLDPIVTPKVKKITRYYFTVKNDVVVASKTETAYER